MKAILAGRAAAAGGQDLQTDLQGTFRAGAMALGLLIGVLGLWSATTVISGAVVAQGQVVVQGKAQMVQSLDGGIVEQIAVKNGDRVTQGQLLARLDPTLVALNLDVARNRLADLLALQARLQSEHLGLTAPRFDYPPLPFTLPDTQSQEEGQRQIFAARAAVLSGQRDRLEETEQEFTHQIAGSDGQIAALNDQIAVVAKEMENQRQLLAKGLTRQSQLVEMQRAHAGLLGQLAALEAERARLQTARRDSALETLQGERSFREQVVTDLNDTTAKVDELKLEIVTRQAQLDRVELRAPTDGIVHEMQVATVGGVVVPGATMMEIIPIGQGVDFELRVDPHAIDQVHVGQSAEVVITSLDPRATPRLIGTVVSVPPAATAEPQSGKSFYRIGLSIPAAEIARLGKDVALIPGMPIDAYLQTSDRSVLTYLLHPLTSQLRRAFRED